MQGLVGYLAGPCQDVLLLHNACVVCHLHGLRENMHNLLLSLSLTPMPRAANQPQDTDTMPRGNTKNLVTKKQILLWLAEALQAELR